MADRERPGEAELIAKYFAPLATGEGARGLRDDAMSIAPPAGHEIVVTTDTLVAGVHFFGNEPPDMLAAKVLRVNLSDLTAKGAAPIGYLLSLSLAEDWTEAWLADFARRLEKDQKQYGWSLLGGDTTKTPGPLTITITAIGSLPAGSYVSRDTAQAGDLMFVSGTIGDAVTGLHIARDSKVAARFGLDKEAEMQLLAAHRTPRPPVGIIASLRAHARAAMDISDGLAGDCEKMCRASGVCATIEAARVPLSEPMQRAIAAKPGWLEMAITGGDDYQVLASVAPGKADDFEKDAAAAGVTVTRIGVFDSGAGKVTVLGPDGRAMPLTHKSYSHF